MTATLEQWRAAFLARTRRTPKGGHRLWQGPLASGGTPVMFFDGEKISAARVAFRIAYGRQPVGYVKCGCELAGCVEPRHQTDRLIRQEQRRPPEPVVDMVAVELAVAGELDDPGLTPAEKREAVRLAPPTMPVYILARRIGACSRTVKALRAEVTTS
ncbi:hypothetical protein DI272_19225 [Streptomyces sp. Act143]|uniref:hypothetical protein n=1 Tax=Streptomyces sp. Act143 TaxID=2200760 RepID=UPI000D67666E|nr:hypothetical protein [Streptomyces sp. Act143]PWI16063.1 hypothetical protein DI272_19225 [Streptomyces sp. Act143]